MLVAQVAHRSDQTGCRSRVPRRSPRTAAVQEQGMAVSFETYEQVALEDDEQWELVCGRLRKKPGVTWEHGSVISNLHELLASQLDRAKYRIREEKARLRIASGSYYVPDLVVVAVSQLERGRRERPF